MDGNTKNNGLDMKAEATREHYPPLEFNIEEYKKYLSDGDLTDEQQETVIVLLWQLVLALVDSSFGIHPIQQARTSRTAQRDEMTAALESAILNAR